MELQKSIREIAEELNKQATMLENIERHPENYTFNEIVDVFMKVRALTNDYSFSNEDFKKEFFEAINNRIDFVDSIKIVTLGFPYFYKLVINYKGLLFNLHLSPFSPKKHIFNEICVYHDNFDSKFSKEDRTIINEFVNLFEYEIDNFDEYKIKEEPTYS